MHPHPRFLTLRSVRSAFAFLVLAFAPVSAPLFADDRDVQAPPVQAAPAAAVTYETLKDISYYKPEKLEGAGEYQKSKCKLDLYYPKGVKDYPTFIWLHGGGLTSGERSWPELREKQIALVSVSYRLGPEGKLPDFMRDTAAATAWVMNHIAEYGGDPKKVFLGGHSAGGYLAALVGMDPQWMAAEGFKNTDLAGLIPVSAQVTTHFYVRSSRGDTSPQFKPAIDEFAPIYHAANKMPPICLIVGDRAKEWKARVEENEFLFATLRALGNDKVEFHEVKDFDHGLIPKPAAPIALEFIRKIEGGQPPVSP